MTGEPGSERDVQPHGLVLSYLINLITREPTHGCLRTYVTHASQTKLTLLLCLNTLDTPNKS